MPAKQRVTIPVHFLNSACKNVAKMGYDIDTMLLDSGINPELTQQPQARVSAIHFARLMRKLWLVVGDELCHMLPRPYLPGCFALSCQLAINCDTLGSALKSYTKFNNVLNTGIHQNMEINGDDVHIQIIHTEPHTEIDRFAFEMLSLVLYRFCNWLIKKHVALKHVSFVFPSHDNTDEYHHQFLGAPVKFDCDMNEIVFNKSYLSQPIAQTTASSRRFLRRAPIGLFVQEFDHDNIVSGIRTIISRDLIEVPTLAQVAEELELTIQTLHRRLKKLGLSFQALKDQVRRDASIYLLGKEHLSIEDIAYQVGFSESSSFTRTFKSWTGVTPSKYRKANK